MTTEKYFDKKKCSFTLSESVLAEFRDACAKHGMKMSPRLEVLMKEDAKALNEMGKVPGGEENEKTI